MPFVVGETVGPYRIVEQLGKGGMASVFKAYHPALDRYVALKAMHPAFQEDPNFLARFQREARVVARLDHPNIVPIYDFSEHQGQPYLVMKYIQGETLKARMTRGPLATEELVRIVDAIGKALAYAHGRGVLHRDIKPSNVLLAEDGNIYLADFGLARIAQAGPSTLSSDVMMGTPQYISPEQAMGKGELGVPTDIYSFGVTLYEILVGQVPFTADTPYSIIHDHIYTPLPLPTERNPVLPEAVERVLLKALAKDPADRFDSVESLVTTFIRAVTPGEPPGPPEDTLLPAAAGEPVEPSEAGSTPGDLPLGGAPAAAPAAFSTVESEEEPEPRRRWRWWYLVPILGLLCICGLVALGQFQDGTGSTPAGEAPGTATLEAGPSDDPVAAARQKVADHPEDPQAQVELAAALYAADHPEEAQDALSRGLDLAEGDPELLLQAGDWLADQEHWLLAAATYLRLASALPGPPPADVQEKLDLSLYLAAGDANARPFLGLRSDRVRGVDPRMLEIAQARFQLYHGSALLAQNAVNNLLEREPGYTPAHLLQAEVHMNRGQVEPAVQRLEELSQIDSGPAWVPAVAEFYLSEYNRD